MTNDRPHIVDGEFQSDKYPSCPRGKVPLSVKDESAQDLLWEYAQRRRSVDSEFAEDLEWALLGSGYAPEREVVSFESVSSSVSSSESESAGLGVPPVWATASCSADRPVSRAAVDRLAGEAGFFVLSWHDVHGGTVFTHDPVTTFYFGWPTEVVAYLSSWARHKQVHGDPSRAPGSPGRVGLVGYLAVVALPAAAVGGLSLALGAHLSLAFLAAWGTGVLSRLAFLRRADRDQLDESAVVDPSED